MADDSALEKILAAVEGLSKRMDAMEAGDQPSNQDVINAREKEELEALRAEAKADRGRKDAVAVTLPRQVAETKRLRDELDRKERELSQAMRECGTLTDRERAQMADIQARHDSVEMAFGRQAPAPMSGESPRAYRARLLNRLKVYHPELREANLSGEEMSVLDAFEKSIFDAAIAEAKHPNLDLPEQGLRKVVRRDASGRDIVEWYGKESFVKQFSSPVVWRGVGRFKTAEDIALASIINSFGGRKY